MLPKDDSRSPGARLRSLIATKTVVLPGTFNAAVGLLAQETGFEAVYISGAGLVNATAGYPDIGLFTMDEMATQAGYIARSLSVPAICDADTGYGEVLQVRRTVQAFEHAGLAGLHLEDQVAPKRCGHLDGKSLVSVIDMERKLAAAAAARSTADFMLIARTDARSVEGFEASVERSLRYLEAGADAVFPEALESRDEFAEFADRVDTLLLANMTEFGKSPVISVSEFAQMGYRMVIFPMTAFRVMMKSAEELFRDLHAKGTQIDWLSRMQSREELYDLLRYDEYAKIDSAVKRGSKTDR
jgi:methylisocitrate lyase